MDSCSNVMSCCIRECTQPPVGSSPFANGVHLEADIFEHSVIENATPIEEEGWLHHRVIELVIWIRLELIPLGEHNKRMSSINCFLRTVGENESALVNLYVMVLELGQSIFFLHLWIVDGHDGAILQEHVAYGDRRSLSYISCILLEGESQNGDLLLGDCIEKGGYGFPSKGLLLVFIHVDNLLPILSYLVQTLGLADVDEVEDVLLEARSTKSD